VIESDADELVSSTSDDVADVLGDSGDAGNDIPGSVHVAVDADPFVTPQSEDSGRPAASTQIFSLQELSRLSRPIPRRRRPKPAGQLDLFEEQAS
jgi:hypothetical protein